MLELVCLLLTLGFAFYAGFVAGPAKITPKQKKEIEEREERARIRAIQEQQPDFNQDDYYGRNEW